MKKLSVLCVLLLVVLLAACTKEENSEVQEPTKTTSTEATQAEAEEVMATTEALPVAFKDGDYNWEGKPDKEGYQTIMTYKIENGLIKDLDWYIYDVKRDRKFDETYKEVYEGQQHYIDQSIADWAGAITYGPTLIANQGETFDEEDISDLDAISGATWTFNKFKFALTYSAAGIEE